MVKQPLKFNSKRVSIDEPISENQVNDSPAKNGCATTTDVQIEADIGGFTFLFLFFFIKKITNYYKLKLLPFLFYFRCTACH